MGRSIIIEADTKKEAFKRFRRTKRKLVNGKLVKLVPISVRKTRREGIMEITFRGRKRRKK